MFGRRKKVDLEELLQELAGNEDEDGRARVKKRAAVSEDEPVEASGVKFKVEFEGVDELIKEIRSLRESINELIDLLKEQGSAVMKK
ncbi:MAG: hypothetical protein AT718_07505 [Vulcanisaeta sp. JCHS_4]|jgi:hypothetical protein|nr:MAG: hypothetical protein AT718_07505 [Vulcanisaeta sp. JCHS_4]